MNLLPTDSYLGNLRIVEVYDYFDIPCLFTCINNSGQQFLAIWIDEMEDSNLWLYVPVSSDRLKLLKDQEIDLRKAFLRAEDNYVFKVKVDKYEPKVSIADIISSEIHEDYLPEPEEYLQDNTIIDQQISLSQEKLKLEQKAIAFRRPVVNMRLEFSEVIKNSAPIRELGSILVSIQNFIDALGQLKENILTITGSVPKEIKDQVRLSVIGVSEGSFIAEMIAYEQADLFMESLMVDILHEFTSVILSSNNTEKLTQKMKEINIRGARKYREFLMELSKANTQFSINWQSPNLDIKGYADMNKETIQKAIKIINEIEDKLPKTITLIGNLIGINHRLKRFEISRNQDETYKGDIDPNLINRVTEVTTSESKQYKFTLQATKSIKKATEEIIWKYVLLNLEEIHEYEVVSPQNCQLNTLIPHYSPQALKKFTQLAQDVAWLLKHLQSPQSFDYYRQRYLNCMIERKLAIASNRVHQKPLIDEFIFFYGREVLEHLNCMIDYKDSSNWLLNIVRKNRQVFHPIRHILMMRFLFGSAEAFFKNEDNYKPFGDAPWLCFNGAVDHYKQPVVTN